jgi:tetratricopeptide (TPR) repeat protein
MTDPLSRSEEVVRSGYRDEAARLLWRAGQSEDAARRLLAELSAVPPAGGTVPSLQPALRWRLAALSAELYGRADANLGQQVAAVLQAEAERTLSPLRAAELWLLRAALLETAYPQPLPGGGPVEDSLQRALAAEPSHGPALLRLHLRAAAAPSEALAHSPLVHTLVAALRTRFESSQKRPEGMMWALRLAAAQEHESGDAPGALATYHELRGFAPAHPALLGLEETLSATAWRAGQAMEIIEHELASEADYDVRFALLLQAGEYLEAHHQPAQAAKRFAQALEIRPGHPVARSAQVRAYQAAGMLDELAKVTAVELKEATDIQTRVLAFERQALLATLRGGDPVVRREAIIDSYRSILNIDANNHSAMRALERHHIAHEQWGDLIHLYEQMGLTAMDTAFAVHIHLDRARLRQRLVWQGQGDASAVTNELENDFRLALYRDRHSRPALRYLLAAALRKDDLPQIATLYLSAGELGSLPGEELGPDNSEAQSAAVFFVRAAEAQAAQGRPPAEVITNYRLALKRFPEHLAALRGMLHFAISHQSFAAVADAAEGLAQHLHDADERYLHYMLGGVVAQELLKDLPRARRAFTAGLNLLPQREEAFGRLRGSYAGGTASAEDARALAELISHRLSQPDFAPANEVTLRMELALLYAGPLGDRDRAKQEMGQALALSPNNPGVLYALGKLYADDRQWQPAVEHLLRYAQVEQRPAQLIAVHLMVGEIFAEQLDNLQQAVAQYTRVLQLQPQNQLALTKLSDMFLAQNKGAGALPLLRRLVKYTDDKQKKIAFYHRIAALSEDSGDPRGALEALRQAVDVDPAILTAIGELARHYERQNDLQSLRIHLDRAAGRFRPLLRERPRDPALYRALLEIFLWRRTTDLSSMAAGALVALGAAVPAELQLRLDKQPLRKEPSRDGLRDPAIDDVLYPPRLAPGFRALFKLLQEPLGKLYGSDAKKLQALGVDRREKLPRSGHPLRDLANRIAAELGVGDFELYITSAQGKDDEGRAVPLYTIEPTEPPSLILSSSLVDGSDAERRFFLSGLLKLLQSQLVLPLRLSSDDLGVLVGGLVRQFVPDYAPLGFAEKRIVNEAQRQKRAIPSKLQPQVLPYAMECASATLDFEGIADTLTMASHHAGLLLTGSLPGAVAALRKKGPGAERQIDELLRFAVSDEFAELQRLAAAR